MPPATAHPEHVPFPDVTGVILAGGQSQRMGRDKASLVLAGQTLVERIAAVLRPLFPALLIAGDRPDLARTDLPCVVDLYPGSALGGLHAALRRAQTPFIFAVACDMPLVREDLVRAIAERRGDCDVVVPRLPGGFEPLFALYRKNCLGPMEAMLAEGNFRIFDFYPRVRTCTIEAAELPAGWSEALRNINTPDDFFPLQGEQPMRPPVVSVVAKSGTGKTTLLEKLIPELKSRGYRVGTVKHDAHRFDIDREGKDSWRMTRAGADTMLITSPAKIAMVKMNTAGAEPSLEETIGHYFGDVDVVLTEGFKKSAMPKIEVHRQERSPHLMCRGEEHDPTLIAVASDSSWELDVPVFGLDDAVAICDLIEARFLKGRG